MILGGGNDHIQLNAAQVFFQINRIQFTHHQPHIGKMAVQIVHHGRQQIRPNRRQHAQFDLPVHPPTAQGVFQIIDLAQDFTNPQNRILAQRGQRGPRAPAQKQFATAGLFQIRNLCRQGWLRHIQPPRSQGKLTRFRNGHDIFHLSQCQFHIV